MHSYFTGLNEDECLKINSYGNVQDIHVVMFSDKVTYGIAGAFRRPTHCTTQDHWPISFLMTIENSDKNNVNFFFIFLGSRGFTLPVPPLDTTSHLLLCNAFLHCVWEPKGYFKLVWTPQRTYLDSIQICFWGTLRAIIRNHTVITLQSWQLFHSTKRQKLGPNVFIQMQGFIY